MYRIPNLRTVVLFASLALAAGCSAGTTEPELLHTGDGPLYDGIGWFGGGGRSDTTATTTTTTSESNPENTNGVGVFGGGG